MSRKHEAIDFLRDLATPDSGASLEARIELVDGDVLSRDIEWVDVIGVLVSSTDAASQEVAWTFIPWSAIATLQVVKS